MTPLVAALASATGILLGLGTAALYLRVRARRRIKRFTRVLDEFAQRVSAETGIPVEVLRGSPPPRTNVLVAIQPEQIQAGECIHWMPMIGDTPRPFADSAVTYKAGFNGDDGGLTDGIHCHHA